MFGSLMRFGDGDENDDIFGAQMQNMNHMMNSMNSMFANPFGMMGGMGMGGMGMGAMSMGGMGMGGFMPPMMPQMPNMNQLMSQMQSNGNCHSYSSSTVMSMTNGPDGRPQVYQATSSTRSAPGGIKETKKAVCDSRTGVKKLAIGHAIGDKAHIIEREQNMRSGEQEERQDYINLDEEESDAFNQEWQQKARQAQLLQHSIDYPQQSSQGRHQQIRGSPEQPMLALPEQINDITNSCTISDLSKQNKKRSSG
uniref:Myeloid leukemia factor n=1 Tax=Cacopsylla melanoneura TaxID=428564 RepID=A0A8D8V199_9HEMI